MNIPWAFNSATVMNSSWDEELQLWQQYEWRAVEIWFSKIEARLAQGATYDQLARQMGDAGAVPVGLCAAGISTAFEKRDRAREYADMEKRLDMAAAMGAPSLTVIIDGGVGEDLAQEYTDLIDPLRHAAELAGARDLEINLEFLGGLPINGTLGSGIELVNRVDHPAFGMLFDFCHYYCSMSHLEELPQLPAEKLFMVHVDDSQSLPMERLRNDQRCVPGEGRIPVMHLMKHMLHDRKYQGYFSVELYDPEIWKLDPHELLPRLGAALRNIEREIEVS